MNISIFDIEEWFHILDNNSTVSKNIPAWKIATGRAVRVIKEIPKKYEDLNI